MSTPRSLNPALRELTGNRPPSPPPVPGPFIQTARTTREEFAILTPRLDRAFWWGLFALVAVGITASVSFFLYRLAVPRGAIAGFALLIGELILLAVYMVRLRARAHGQAARLEMQQMMLEEQSHELEARAAALEGEANRSRALADYLRSANLELRESLEALSRARAEADSAVKASQHTSTTLDVVLASAPFGIALLDRNLRFERVNEALAMLDGISAEEHSGRRVREVAPELGPVLEPVLTRVLDTQQPVLGLQFETAPPAAPGRKRQWSISVYPVRSSGGEVRGVGIIVVDTTERNDLERQLLHAQKMEAVGRLASSIGHDFNNLLTAISAFAQFAREDIEEGHPALEDLGQIMLATERGSALTRRLLAFSRQQVAEPRALDLNRVIVSLESLLRRVLGEDVNLVTRLHPSLHAVDVDPGQLEQVILNLAINARDAMPGGGTLTIETENVELDEEYVSTHLDAAPGPHVLLAITDTGSGMDARTQEHIFEPFFTTKPLGKGTGLGLSTVHDIVRQAGGTIWLQSERGHGTTFKVYFPRSRQPVEAPAATVDQGASRELAPMTVLLVEDDTAVRQAMHRVLTRHGCRVYHSENSRQALDILGKLGEAVDLIVTDVIMPEMGGLEFAERVQGAWPSIRMLLMSGYTSDPAHRQALIEAGVTFLEKPFTTETLIARIREVMARRRGSAAA